MKPWECSLLWSEGGAHSAAEEDKHPNEANDPNNKGDIEVICHVPRHAFSGIEERTSTDSIILCEHKGTNDDEDNELEEANEESAVDRADSPSVSPGANEHEKRVEADKTVDNTHEGSDQSQLRACFLAVNVAVINQLNIILEEVFEEAFIAYSDISGNCDVNVVSTLSLLTG